MKVYLNNLSFVLNELVIKKIEKIEDMIYEVRGVQVILASDVAKLYQIAWS